MTYSAIMAWTAENRVAKLADFGTQAEAQAHITAFAGAYPNAFAVETPAAPVDHWLIDPAAKTVSVAPPAPPRDAINDERARRIAAGATITVTGVGPIPVQGGSEHERNLSGLAQAATLRLMSGDTTTVTVFRDAANADHNLVPGQIIELWQKSAGYVSAIYQASWVIKALDPIPQDYAANARWPSSTVA